MSKERLQNFFEQNCIDGYKVGLMTTTFRDFMCNMVMSISTPLLYEEWIQNGEWIQNEEWIQNPNNSDSTAKRGPN